MDKHTAFAGRGYKVKATAKLISMLGLVDLVLLRSGLVSRGFASGREASQCLLNCERVSRLRATAHYGCAHVKSGSGSKFSSAYGLDSGLLPITTGSPTSFSKPQGSTSCSFKFSSYCYPADLMSSSFSTGPSDLTAHAPRHARPSIKVQTILFARETARALPPPSGRGPGRT